MINLNMKTNVKILLLANAVAINVINVIIFIDLVDFLSYISTCRQVEITYLF